MRTAPVSHISYFEADAYARWAAATGYSRRFEWEADRPGEQGRESAHRGQSAQLRATSSRQSRASLQRSASHPFPALVHAARSMQSVVGGIVGSGPPSAYLGYPGFRPLPGSLGEYNGKFMSGQMVLRGGSCVTPADHIRATYRNFFRPKLVGNFLEFGSRKHRPQLSIRMHRTSSTIYSALSRMHWIKYDRWALVLPEIRNRSQPWRIQN